MARGRRDDTLFGEEKSVAAIEVKVPDVGTDKAVDVIEVNVKAGDRIAADQTIIVLESEKATVEVPSPAAGVVQSVALKVGDQVTQGALVLVLSAADDGESSGRGEPATPAVGEPPPQSIGSTPPSPQDTATTTAATRGEPATAAISATPSRGEPAMPAIRPDAEAAPVHAGPAVRKLARELGVNLVEVSGTGPKQRILKDDVHAHVKRMLTQPRRGGSGAGLPELPVIDFSKWGPVENLPLAKLRRVAAQNLHRAWLTIPHVTQHDEADVTELEDFRVFENGRRREEGVKLTMLAFLVKASVHALQKYPKFNSSLSLDGESLVLKRHWHIGIAVETPEGLVVPVIRDADRKGVLDIAREMGELSKKARDRKLLPSDMQGATFSISSLGGIGGTAFTPIVNWPEVAILGVSKAQTKPVWDGKQFQPRLMLPLSLSYDHRVIDGADAARFITFLSALLADLRRMLL